MRKDCVLVCYDIGSNRTRRRLDKLLKPFGIRYQRSVYLCRLDDRQYGELLEQLRAFWRKRTRETTEVAIDVITCCPACWSRHRSIGNTGHPMAESNIVV